VGSVGGDFNLGHMDWETLSVFPGKPNQKQHQQFLDIINDNSLTQVVNKTTRKDNSQFVFSSLASFERNSFVTAISTPP
jgi:hypothetical protein